MQTCPCKMNHFSDLLGQDLNRLFAWQFWIALTRFRIKVGHIIIAKLLIRWHQLSFGHYNCLILVGNHRRCICITSEPGRGLRTKGCNSSVPAIKLPEMLNDFGELRYMIILLLLPTEFHGHSSLANGDPPTDNLPASVFDRYLKSA